MFRKKILIYLPAYNEEKTVSQVIYEVKKHAKNVHIIVINDGSKDNTKEVVKKTKTLIISLPFNLGIGGAVQTGLKYALENHFDYAIQVDSDGQHDPRYIPKLLKKAIEGYDLVIGSRYLKKTTYEGSWARSLGNTIFSYLIFLLYGKRIYDTTSGFRVLKRRAIAFLVKDFPIDLPEPESIVKLLKAGYTIAEVPVEMRWRAGGTSSVTPIKAIYFMLSISLSILIERIKKK